VAGDSDRADVSSTFLQPFVSYITKTYTTIGLNTESTYDWENSQWTVPLNPARPTKHSPLPQLQAPR